METVMEIMHLYLMFIHSFIQLILLICLQSVYIQYAVYLDLFQHRRTGWSLGSLPCIALDLMGMCWQVEGLQGSISNYVYLAVHTDYCVLSSLTFKYHSFDKMSLTALSFQKRRRRRINYSTSRLSCLNLGDFQAFCVVGVRHSN